MRKKTESLKNKELKKYIIDNIQSESSYSIKLQESSKTKYKESFHIPIYIDLSEYKNDKLNDIIEENYDDIIDGLNEDDFFNTLSMTFDNLEEKEFNISFSVSNFDNDNEECINIIINY